MQPIVFPINAGDSGPQVANLIQALLVFVERHVIKPVDDANGPSADELRGVAERARKELSPASFGKATQPLVEYFQQQHVAGHAARGSVDAATADRMNELLSSLGLLEEGTLVVVAGYVRGAAKDGEAGEPVAGVVVHAFDQDVTEATELGHATTDATGKYSISFPEQAYIAGDIGYAALDELAAALRNIAHVAPPKVVKSGPDLWVGIPAGNGAYAPKSAIVYNAGLRTAIDLTVVEPERPRDSDLEELLRLMLPRLKDLPLDKLTDDQIAFLSNGAEIAIDGIQALVAGAKLVAAIKELAGKNET